MYISLQEAWQTCLPSSYEVETKGGRRLVILLRGSLTIDLKKTNRGTNQPVHLRFLKGDNFRKKKKQLVRQAS